MSRGGRLLAGLVLVSGVLCVLSLGGWGLPAWVAFGLKPPTTLLIIAHAWLFKGASPPMRCWLLRGLCLSLAGDVFLLWPQSGFLPGLVSFLLAHLCYIVAFSQPLRFAARRLPLLGYGLVGVLVLLQLWPGVPADLRAPVLVYVSGLVAMAAQAASWWLSAPQLKAARWAALGGGLFMLSDALLAFDKFAYPLPAAPLWILASYWLAQWCIASSLDAPVNQSA